MSAEDEENKIYDLTRVEDVFACLEITAMAQAALEMTEPEIAAGLEKVTEALGALSITIEMGDLVQVVEKIVEVEKVVETAGPKPGQRGPITDLVDLTDDEYDDSIIDILTGEKIR